MAALSYIPDGIPTLQVRLLAWYAQNRRDLPWRSCSVLPAEPGERAAGDSLPASTQFSGYTVLVSEMMLQQTRVATVLSKYMEWMRVFPTVQALAAASSDDAQLAWAGLGYYRRARALHAAARLVCERHGGQVPRSLRELQALPGVGRYTAGAVASIAYGQPVPAVDGNVTRVLARLVGLPAPAGSAALSQQAWAVAEQLVPDIEDAAIVAAAAPVHPASAWTQALIELGATVCTPTSPRCHACPIAQRCHAREALLPAEHWPIAKCTSAQAEASGSPARQRSLRQEPRAAIVHFWQGSVWLQRRPATGLLAGQLEAPSALLACDAEPATYVQGLGIADVAAICRLPGLVEQCCAGPGFVQHTFTHLKYHMAVLPCVHAGGCPDTACWGPGQWVQLADLPEAGLCTCTAKVLVAAAIVANAALSGCVRPTGWIEELRARRGVAQVLTQQQPTPGEKRSRSQASQPSPVTSCSSGLFEGFVYSASPAP